MIKGSDSADSKHLIDLERKEIQVNVHIVYDARVRFTRSGYHTATHIVNL